MLDADESCAPHVGAVVSLQRELSAWFIDHALPLWEAYGVDREGGGFFEVIGSTGAESRLESSGDIRRGRVVARQIYVFDVGRRAGWRAQGLSPVEHGCEYLFTRLYRGDGRWHTALHAATYGPRGPFSLYEHAFYLFALARVSMSMEERYPIAVTAAQCREHLRSSLGKSLGGFEESNPPTLPLKSNPHMHLLEAALAWVEVTEGAAQAPWVELARELVGLCLTRFRDASRGVLREYFDQQWRAAPGEEGRIVEPGHQFEWAWLLMRWASTVHCGASSRVRCLATAGQLIELAEQWGVDAARGVAVNEIWDDLTMKDSAAKLWPQTERIKAWCAMLAVARSTAETERACRQIAVAARGMIKYLRTDVPGLWHEVYEVEGQFTPGPSRASSLYHVACAIDVLSEATRHHVQGALSRNPAAVAS